MHYPVINEDRYYDKILEKLEVGVPEFESVFEREYGVYPILGEFGRFVIENVDNEKVCRRVFDFISDAIENGGVKTEEVIVLEIFQPIYDSALVPKVKPYLSEKALDIFETFLAKYVEDI